MSRLRQWARRLKGEIAALWFCARHPRTPFMAKALAAALIFVSWLAWRWTESWIAL